MLRHRLPHSLREASRSRPICVLAVVSHVCVRKGASAASHRLRICTSRERWRRPSRCKKNQRSLPAASTHDPCIHHDWILQRYHGDCTRHILAAVLCPEHGHPTCATVLWLRSQEGQRRTATLYVVREVVPGVAADVAEPLRRAITAWVRLHHTRHNAVTSGAECATFHRGTRSSLCWTRNEGPRTGSRQNTIAQL